jgi:glycine cleavage system H protein
MEFPADLKYTKEHAWVRLEGAEAIVGITGHAQQQLGDVVFVEAPQAGAVVTRGKAYGVVESVKSVSDLYAPLSGTITRVNGDLASTPELVNQDPYGKGWMIAVTIADAGQLAGLMSAEQYAAQVAGTGQTAEKGPA